MNTSPILTQPIAFKNSEVPVALQETWYLKWNHPSSQQAFALEWDVMRSHNGFKRVAEIRAFYFQRTAQREIRKLLVQQTFGIESFSKNPELDTIQIAKCHLSPGSSHGKIHSKGQTLEWDLSFETAQPGAFQLIPEFINRWGLQNHTTITPHEDLLFSGELKINGEIIEVESAPGMLGRSHCQSNWFTSVWAHCNHFEDEQGKSSPFIFEGISAHPRIGALKLPAFSSLYFKYQDQEYFFNHLRDILHMKSHHGLNDWQFAADRDDLSFRGHVSAEHKDFLGFTSEDTNGSILYRSYSLCSQMKILVYRRGKLEATLSADGTCSFEVTSRQKNPYIPLLT